MKKKRKKAIFASIGTTSLAFAAMFTALLICAVKIVPKERAGIIGTAVFSCVEIAAGMELILIPDKESRITRLMGVAVICLSLILVPVYGYFSGFSII